MRGRCKRPRFWCVMKQTELQKNDAHYLKMTTAPVGPLILSLAVPSMVTTLITSIYNLADTFFVGQIGTSATAAVGVVFSISMVLLALGFWVGTGASMLVSSMLGARREQDAQTMANTSFVLSFAFGVALAVVCFAGGDTLLRMLGATETILPYARQYAFFILLGGPFSACSMAFGQCLRAEGLSRESMVGQISGGVLNMLLDPLFIFGFGWGIAGAAAATMLSQMVSWAINLQFYLRGITRVKLDVRTLARRWEQYRLLFTTGAPSLFRHCCNMLANVVLNTVAGSWGDAAIAAMSICARLLYLSNAVSNGMNQGSQPVIGYAYGKQDWRRVRASFTFSVKVSMLSMVAFGVVGIAFAPQLVGIFRDDPQVIEVGRTALRLICVALPLANFANSANILFQIVGRPVTSTVLIFGRQLAFYIPALLLLPRFCGLLGVQMAGPLADIVVFAIALPLTLRYFRSLPES